MATAKWTVFVAKSEDFDVAQFIKVPVKSSEIEALPLARSLVESMRETGMGIFRYARFHNQFNGPVHDLFPDEIG